MADRQPKEPKPSLGERARHAYHAALGERPVLVWWLVSPTLVGTALDVWLRHGTLRYFPPRQWLNYFGSSLVSAGFWGGALWMFAVWLPTGGRRAKAAFAAYFALFVLPFSFFAYGGQAVYFRVFDSYVARDTIRLGLELRGTVGAWMSQWATKLWPAALSAALVSALVLVAVRRAGPSLRRAVPLVPMVSFLGSSVALWQDFVETKGLQAAPPDSCFLHGVVGLVHERIVSRAPPKGLSIRRPAPLPALVRPEHRPSVVLVITESVRRDVLCSTPGACEARFLDAVAPERVGFGRMTTQASGTFSACMILWTGLGPDADFQAVHEAPFLWEIAKAQGYRTGYFSSQNLRYRDLGVYLRVGGIDTLVSATELGDTEDPHLGAPDERAMERMLEWVGASTEPYFAVLHLSNTHWPYRVDPALQPFEPHDADPMKGDVRLLFNHYRNSVLLQERSLSSFLRELKSRPSWADTALFFVSDHGEQFREHGRLYHLNNLFEEEIHVPGFALFGERAIDERGAAQLRKYADRRVYGDDLNATIVDLLGAWDARLGFAHASRLGGRSLLRPRLVRGEPVVAASTTSGVWVDNDPVYGVIWGDWKAVGDDATPWACLNLSRDPAERLPIPAAECPSLVREAARRFPNVPTSKK
ncbi:MAG: sulfatase-like hydrolase/transferase [Polyangiaceae bacterium]|nr:sulfatase-like hydrolase/transferase [Polyangiaceae bacterium]